jgi:hypothetical protein
MNLRPRRWAARSGDAALQERVFDLKGEAHVDTFVDTLGFPFSKKRTEDLALQGLLLWAGQGSNLRPWD